MALMLALSLACSSETPQQPTAPVVVATPAPTPTPAPSLGNPAVSATVKMFGYTRNEGSNKGRFPIPPAPPYFQIADWIDLDCTPRDAEGRETRNHPPLAEWYPSSGGEGVLVIDYDYTFEDGASYTPQIQLRYLARTGFIDVYCKLPGTNVTSNTIRIPVRGEIR
jgi:hypothetical protein